MIYGAKLEATCTKKEYKTKKFSFFSKKMQKSTELHSFHSSNLHTKPPYDTSHSL